MSSAMQELISILDLEPLEHNLFRGRSPQVGWQRVFGGQVIAQALVAAQRCVDAQRHVHSLHCYFMRPGDPAVPIIYEVDRIRDGGTFATRRVKAIQHGQAIFTLAASFQIDEPGLDHQIPMPLNVPGPDSLMSDKDFREKYLAASPEHIRKFFERERPFEMKPVSLNHYLSKEKLPPEQNVWFKATGDAPDDRAIQNAMLAYFSDMTLLDATLFAHGKSIFEPGLQVASLDHSMWFHRPVNLDEWLLYTQDSPSTSGGRGFARGSIYTQSGVLVASTAQEGLIRMRTSA
jgi:acyl-CoA thioesterase II